MAKDPKVLITAVATLVLALVFLIILLNATSELLPEVQNSVSEVGTQTNILTGLFSATGAILIFIVASCFIITLKFIFGNFLSKNR